MAKKKRRTQNIRLQYCPNPQCPYYGQTEQKNVVCNGRYRTKTKGVVQQFLCKVCKETWTQYQGTFFYHLRTPRDKILLTLKLLVRGMTLRGIAEVMGVKLDTVRYWLKRASEHSAQITPFLMKDLKVKRTEVDALWSFVKKNELRKRASLWKVKSRLGSVLPRRLV